MNQQHNGGGLRLQSKYELMGAGCTAAAPPGNVWKISVCICCVSLLYNKSFSTVYPINLSGNIQCPQQMCLWGLGLSLPPSPSPLWPSLSPKGREGEGQSWGGWQQVSLPWPMLHTSANKQLCLQTARRVSFTRGHLSDASRQFFFYSVEFLFGGFISSVFWKKNKHDQDHGCTSEEISRGR